MSAGLLAQYVVVGMVIVASVLTVARKLAPQRTNRWLAAASIRLGRHGRSRLMNAIARRLQPKEATGSCADGCATCGACGPQKSAGARPSPDGAMPLVFREDRARSDRPRA